ncbi:hypothetical protein [Lentzea sp. NPDC059081]|uniref:hypothetical protein n=1 Tax=Lentzea sp. NPDC059081 TaxID=3346719 RepID=UPI00367E2292
MMNAGTNGAVKGFDNAHTTEFAKYTISINIEYTDCSTFNAKLNNASDCCPANPANPGTTAPNSLTCNRNTKPKRPPNASSTCPANTSIVAAICSNDTPLSRHCRANSRAAATSTRGANCPASNTHNQSKSGSK